MISFDFNSYSFILILLINNPLVEFRSFIIHFVKFVSVCIVMICACSDEIKFDSVPFRLNLIT